VKENLCWVFIVYQYTCISVGDPIIKRGGLGSHVRTWIYIGKCCGVFCVQWYEVRDWLFVLLIYGSWNCSLSMFKFLFIIKEKDTINYIKFQLTLSKIYHLNSPNSILNSTNEIWTFFVFEILTFWRPSSMFNEWIIFRIPIL
jgi:hypothetical protein